MPQLRSRNARICCIEARIILRGSNWDTSLTTSRVSAGNAIFGAFARRAGYSIVAMFKETASGARPHRAQKRDDRHALTGLQGYLKNKMLLVLGLNRLPS